jgi:hypothetical protein
MSAPPVDDHDASSGAHWLKADGIAPACSANALPFSLDEHYTRFEELPKRGDNGSAT